MLALTQTQSDRVEQDLEQRVAPPGEQVARGPEVLTWVSHPLRRAHKKTALLAIVVVLAASFIGINTRSVAWAVVSAFILLLGVYDYVFPTHYRLTTWGVESRVLFFRRRKAWSGLRSFFPDHNGVLLSPFPGRSRLEAFRGLYIRFEGNRQKVLEFVRGHVARRET